MAAVKLGSQPYLLFKKGSAEEHATDIKPNKYIINALIANLNGNITVNHINGIDIEITSNAELDSHANMIVLRKDCFVFESTGKTCNVKPFSSDLGIAKNIPIVDAALA